jgi:hypothetical protein
MSTELTLVAGSSRYETNDDEATWVDLIDRCVASDEETTVFESPWTQGRFDDATVSRLPLPARKTRPLESGVRPELSSTPHLQPPPQANVVEVIEVARALAVAFAARRPAEPPRTLVSLRCELPAPFLGDEAAERHARRARGGWFGAIVVAAAAMLGTAVLYRSHDRAAPLVSRARAEATQPAGTELSAPDVPAPLNEVAPINPAKHHHAKSHGPHAQRRLPLPPPPDNDPT